MTMAALASDQYQLEKTESDLARVRAEYQQYAYIISHDFGAPIRQIDGFMSLITQHNGQQFDEKTKRHIDFVMTAVNDAKTMLEAMLLYSRIESMGDDFLPCELDTILNDSLQKYESQLREARVNIISHQHLPLIIGDAIQLQQCFENIIHNAITFRKPQLPLNLRITLECKDGNCLIHFKDNGLGIPKKKMGDITQPLRKAHFGEKHQGLGMGLAYAKRIIERHRGSLEIQSEDGHGTEVTIQLPCPKKEQTGAF